MRFLGSFARRNSVIPLLAYLVVLAGLPWTNPASGQEARRRSSSIRIRRPVGQPAVPATSPEPAFRWKAIRAVNSPGEGRGGVLILTDSAGVKLVVKITGENMFGGTFADYALAKLGVPAAQSLVLDSGNKRVESKQPLTFAGTLDLVRQAALAKPATDPDFNRVQQVYSTALGLAPVVTPTPQAVDGKFLLIMKFIPSAADIGSCSQLFGAFNVESLAPALLKAMPASDTSPTATYLRGRAPGTPLLADQVVEQKSAVLVKYWTTVYGPRMQGTRLLLKALAATDGGQAQFLGRLIVLDAFLGNEDRFKPSADGTQFGLNSGNLILTPDATLVAIDNQADPADPRMLALRDFRESRYEQCRTQADNSPPFSVQRLEGPSTPLSRADWVTSVVNGCKLDTGMLTPALESVLARDAGTGTAAKVTAVFKDAVRQMVESMRAVNNRLAPRMGDADQKETNGLTADTNRCSPTSSKWPLLIMMTLKDEGQGRLKAETSATTIDWQVFQTRVQAGIDSALASITDDAAFRPVGSTLSGPWAEGFAIRRAYWKSRRAGKSAADALNSLLPADPAKVAPFNYNLKLEFYRTGDTDVLDDLVFVDP